MTDAVMPTGALPRTGSPYFYFHMSLVCMAVAFLGFLPSYWMPLAQGTFRQAPVTHIHGTIFFAWSLYFVFQSWLGASGQLVRHRAVGLIGVSLATAMFIFGVLVTINQVRLMAAAGQAQAGLSIAMIALSDITLFVVLIASALANIKKTERHKRLMLMAAISILQAPMARWFIYFHVPARLGIDVLTMMLAFVPVLHDWRTRGRVHAAIWVPVTALALLYLVREPFTNTAAWRGFVAWVSGLAG